MRVLIIVAGVVVLLAVIGALVWFFILSPKNQAATTSSGLTEIPEPSPLPKNTGGGFGNLPQATGSGQSTASATPSAR